MAGLPDDVQMVALFVDPTRDEVGEVLDTGTGIQHLADLIARRIDKERDHLDIIRKPRHQRSGGFRPDVAA